jgi:hypothetical protein
VGIFTIGIFLPWAFLPTFISVNLCTILKLMSCRLTFRSCFGAHIIYHWLVKRPPMVFAC